MAIAIVTGFLFAGMAAAGGGVTPILTSTADERHPAVDGPYMTWTQYPHGRPGRATVFARPTAGSNRFRVSAEGTRAYGGGVDGTTFVYQQVNNGNSSIKLFDAVTRTRTDPPAGVNTERWEWSPTVSGQWLLYGQDASRARGMRRVILFNLVTQEKRILKSSRTRGSLLVPGQVSGNYAVFWRYSSRDGKVFVYDIGAQTTEIIQSDRFDYAPSVTSDGDVYWARSGVGCGHARGPSEAKWGNDDEAPRSPTWARSVEDLCERGAEQQRWGVLRPDQLPG